MHPLLMTLGLALAGPALAQSAASTTASTVVITGNPLGRDDFAQPASVLAGDGLAARRAGTLGETLDGLPGVASTWFGPNASRPVIRGLDGDRVRLLDNGGATVDASNLSFDHAVAIDPLAVERIEVLRGPAALLYGGNATGGVVNSIDNRIPRAPLAGLAGRGELRFGGAAAERAGAALVEGGTGAFAWHADAFKRRTDDLRVPRYVPVADGQALEPATRVRNSAADAEGGAVGGSWVSDRGFLGAALDSYRNVYGITAEEDVVIRMKRERLALAGEWRAPGGFWQQLEGQASRTNYQHQEVEGTGEVGTTFKSRGSDLRLAARHRAIGGFSGALGVQADDLDFEALGEEAFVPATRTRSRALFWLEEVALGGVTLSAGLRGERVRVATASEARRFSPASGSLGVRGGGAAGWQWSATLGHTERAPAYYELFADGVHVATGAYERGDPTLGIERSRHAEAGLGWRDGRGSSVRLDVFDTRFARYIALDATGNTVDVDGDPLPEYVFRAVRASLRGAELDGRWRVATAPWAWDLTGGVDVVRGRNLDSGEPLARIAPLRVRAGVEAASGPWKAGAGLRHAARQDRVPAVDTATPGYTLLDLWFTWAMQFGGSEALLSLRLANATDRLAYNAASAPTLRALAPLPGRALSASIRLTL